MKYIFTLALLISLSIISRAEQLSFAPQPVPKPTSPMKIDEYSEIPLKEQTERLRIIAKQIKSYENKSDDLNMAIIFYGEKCGALKRANRTKNYLVKTEGIASDKIRAIYGGQSEVWKVTIYLLPVKTIDTESDIDLSKEPNCQVKRKNPKRRIKYPPRLTSQ